MIINSHLLLETISGPLMRGSIVSLQIAAVACLMGLLGGTILGFMLLSNKRIFTIIAHTYVTIVRGTPMLIQISALFFILPEFGIMIPALGTAMLAIGLNSAAYVSQIVKSGIRSVSKGQIEAAQTLGLSKIQIIQLIILPQAFRVVLPALGNEFITLIKDSSLASIIGVTEITKEGSIIVSRTYDAITTYIAIGIVYLVITSLLSIIVSRLERKMNYHVKH